MLEVQEEIVDAKTINSLMVLDPTGKFLRNSIKKYFSMMDSVRLNLEEAISEKDSKACSELLHRVEGTSSMIGAHEMSSTAKRMRQCINNQDLDILPQFDNSANKTKTVFKMYLSSGLHK